MEIIDNMIIFKSSAHFYEIEESGAKRNTVRRLDYDEYVKVSIWVSKSFEKWIKIRQYDSSVITFKRKLTDASFVYKESLINNYFYVFSW